MTVTPLKNEAVVELSAAVRVLYPYASHQLAVGGLNYHYVDEGHGEPLLMVHGNPTWSFYYRGLINALKANFRTIAPDHIGCGLSDKPDDDHYAFTLEQRVADLEALVEHLGLGDNITLVLHDWGGMIGMAYASRHPHKIKRLILGNTAAFKLPAAKPLPLSLRLCRSGAFGPLLVRGLNAFSRGAAATSVKRQPMTKAVRDGYLAPYDNWHNRRAVLRFVQDIPLGPRDHSYDLVMSVEAALPTFRRTPTLILWGAQDFVFDDYFLETWIKAMPHAEVHRFADAGHYIFEDASEEIMPLVQSFLDRHP